MPTQMIPATFTVQQAQFIVAALNDVPLPGFANKRTAADIQEMLLTTPPVEVLSDEEVAVEAEGEASAEPEPVVE